jgi:hypothetical protein
MEGGGGVEEPDLSPVMSTMELGLVMEVSTVRILVIVVDVAAIMVGIVVVVVVVVGGWDRGIPGEDCTEPSRRDLLSAGVGG